MYSCYRDFSHTPHPASPWQHLDVAGLTPRTQQHCDITDRSPLLSLIFFNLMSLFCSKMASRMLQTLPSPRAWKVSFCWALEQPRLCINVPPWRVSGSFWTPSTPQASWVPMPFPAWLLFLSAPSPGQGPSRHLPGLSHHGMWGGERNPPSG